MLLAGNKSIKLYTQCASTGLCMGTTPPSRRSPAGEEGTPCTIGPSPGAELLLSVRGHRQRQRLLQCEQHPCHRVAVLQEPARTAADCPCLPRLCCAARWQSGMPGGWTRPEGTQQMHRWSCQPSIKQTGALFGALMFFSTSDQ